MAPGMKWTLGLAGLCLVAGWAIVETRRAPFTSLPEQDRVWQTRVDLRDAHRTLIQLETLDSVVSRLPEAPGVRLDLKRPIPERYEPLDPWGNPSEPAEEMSDSAIAIVQAAVDEQLARTGGTRARIAILAVVDRWGGDGMPVQVFSGNDGVGGWCAVTVAIYTGVVREPIHHLSNDPLGPCRMWARYGAPGRGVTAWLPQGGYLLASARPSGADAPVTRRGVFGRRMTGSVLDLTAERCLTGRADGCAAALLDERQWSEPFFLARTDEGPALLARNRYGPEAGPIESWFADLEAELGPEEFERLWRSDEPIEASLDRALEAGADGWLVGWARSRYGIEPRGPRFDFTNLAATLLTIALMLVLSVGVAKRRTIA